MTTQYLDSFIGVKDGSKNPPDKADGRKVGAKRSAIWGAKPAAAVWNIADLIYIGTVRQNESVRDIIVNSDTSLGTATIAIGTLTNPSKYVAPTTMTTTDKPVSIGPKAVMAAAPPLTADDDLYVTLAVAAVAAGVNISFETLISSIK